MTTSNDQNNKDKNNNNINNNNNQVIDFMPKYKKEQQLFDTALMTDIYHRDGNGNSVKVSLDRGHVKNLLNR